MPARPQRQHRQVRSHRARREDRGRHVRDGQELVRDAAQRNGAGAEQGDAAQQESLPGTPPHGPHKRGEGVRSDAGPLPHEQSAEGPRS